MSSCNVSNSNGRRIAWGEESAPPNNNANASRPKTPLEQNLDAARRENNRNAWLLSVFSRVKKNKVSPSNPH